MVVEQVCGCSLFTFRKRISCSSALGPLVHTVKPAYDITILFPINCDTQVEKAQAGLDSLNLSEKTINELRENFISIEKYGLVINY